MESHRKRLPSSPSSPEAFASPGEENGSNYKSPIRTRSRSPFNLRPWSDLPEELLDLISRRLDVVDYFAFGGVCRRWRLLVAELKPDVMEFQPPLIIVISTHAKRACSFFNMVDERRFKTMLPRFTRKSCSGSTGGYLIMQGQDKVWFINPFTRKELYFPGLPYFADHIILLSSSSMPSPNYIVVAVFRCRSYIKFCRYKDAEWTVYSNGNDPWFIVDVAVFKGKLYGVTNDGRTGIFSLGAEPSLTFLEVERVLTWTPYVLLAASDEQLLMVDYHAPEQLRVYELDLVKMKWVKTVNLGDDALFVSDMRYATVSKASRWGGRSNCIYRVGCILKVCHSYSLDGKLISKFSVPGIDPIACFIRPFLWYFPNEIYRIESISDD